MGDIRRLVATHGKETSLCVLMEALEKKELKPEDMSFLELWEAFVGPVGDTLPGASRAKLIVLQEQGAVDITAFAKISSAAIAKIFIEGYEAPGYIGDQLVENYPSRLKLDTVVGFTALGMPKLRPAGTAFQLTGFSEKYVTATAEDYGRTIALTEETIIYDQTGQILSFARGIGERCRQHREKMILGAVMDLTGYKAYRPAGVETNMYQSGGTLQASNPFTDLTDIDNALLLLSQQVDSEGEPIISVAPIVLVPKALEMSVKMVVTSTEVRRTKGSDVTHIGPSPLPTMKVLSSPYVATLQGNSTTWYLGDFPKQFKWKDVTPVRLLTRINEPGSDAFFLRAIVAEYRADYRGECFATDDKYVIKNTA